MILAYRVLTTLLYPFLFLFIYYRKIFNKEDPVRYKEKILVSHFNVKKKNKSKLIWFHAASIGEFKSIIPIIDYLNINNQNYEFLITTTTLSSGNLAKEELQKFNNVEHRYIPFDVNFLMGKFINLWKPDQIFLVDSEIWPNLIFKAKKYNIPIALINARLTLKTFNKWSLFPNVARRIFKIFDLCLCSNLETKNFLERLNIKNVYFKGNIKFIKKIDKTKISNLNENILLKKRFWFAASTHKEEDLFCLRTHLKLKEKFQDLITIIAPRHIDRCGEIKSLFEKSKLSVQILNKNQSILEKNEIIIINYFGALNDYFKYAKSVFIGKSIIEKLKNDGGQNPLEAAKLKCKIYHGPYVYNFKDIYEILEKNNISKTIKNYEELSSNLIVDLDNPKKENNEISEQIKILEQKTLKDTMSLVDNFLND
jgi:3-deoxy-D-manno-octulosonic-acid transferase